MGIRIDDFAQVAAKLRSEAAELVSKAPKVSERWAQIKHVPNFAEQERQSLEAIEQARNALASKFRTTYPTTYWQTRLKGAEMGLKDAQTGKAAHQEFIRSKVYQNIAESKVSRAANLEARARNQIRAQAQAEALKRLTFGS